MVATKQTGEEKVHQRGGGGQSNVSRVQRGKLAWTMPEMSPHPKCTTRLSLSMPDAKAVKTNRGRTTWRTPTLNPRHVRWRRTGDCTGLLLQLRFLTVTVVCCVASTTTIALFASRTTAPSTVVKRAGVACLSFSTSTGRSRHRHRRGKCNAVVGSLRCLWCPSATRRSGSLRRFLQMLPCRTCPPMRRTATCDDAWAPLPHAPGNWHGHLARHHKNVRDLPVMVCDRLRFTDTQPSPRLPQC